MRNQIQRKADTCPGRGRVASCSAPGRGPSRRLDPSICGSSEFSQPGGGEGGPPGAGGEKRRGGPGGTRLASGLCAPKAPGEPSAQRWGLGTAAEGGGPALRPSPSLSVEKPRAPAAESARSEAWTFSFFRSPAKLRDS